MGARVSQSRNTRSGVCEANLSALFGRCADSDGEAVVRAIESFVRAEDGALI